MAPRLLSRRLVPVVGLALLAACGRDLTTLPDAQAPNIAGVYEQNFVAASFQAFGGSDVAALTIDPTTVRNGAPALKVVVPGPGSYAGGAFVANSIRDLSSYNAVTFYAKASKNATLNVAGLGNDNTGTSRFTAERADIPLTTNWTKYTLPIPLASKLTQEKGLFYFAEGPEDGAGYTIWFSDIKYEAVTTISNVRPTIAARTVDGEVGGTLTASGTAVTFAVNGADQTLSAAPGYFSFASSDAAVATVSATGAIQIVGAGTASISATLGTTPAVGAITLRSAVGPAVAAATPTRPTADVISLFSDAYTNVAVNTWSASWDQADVADVMVAGNNTKKYTNLVYAGIEFTGTPVNATAMKSMHLDVFPQGDGPFKVKLVDFGANGVFGGGDDSEAQVTIAVTRGAWNSIDIPFSSFAGLAGRTKLAQMVIEGGGPTLYLDNVYFYTFVVPTTPPTAAPTPTFAAANVVSLFSNAYTNVTVDTWSTGWDVADVEDVLIAGNATKKYTNVVFIGIETIAAPVNASTMTHFVFDLWTPSSTDPPAVFKVKLVDLGANRAFGGGDDVESEITLSRSSTPALVTGSWVRYEIPLSSFTGLTTRGAIGQLILSGNLGTLFLDNVMFRK